MGSEVLVPYLDQEVEDPKGKNMQKYGTLDNHRMPLLPVR